MSFVEASPPALMDYEDFECFPDYTLDAVDKPCITPERSPSRIGGQLLLPRIRPQDQTTEPMAGSVAPSRNSFSHATSRPPNFNPYNAPSLNIFRRSISPPYQSHLISPISAPSDCSPAMSCDFSSPLSFDQPRSGRPTFAHGRSMSATSVKTHSRNTSASSIDTSVLDRYGYPTYRNMPCSVAQTPASKILTALGHLTPISLPSGPLRTPSTLSRSRQPSPSARPTRLSAELLFDPIVDETSTLLDYLTSPNPAPSLVRQFNEPARGQNTYFWFDVRSLRQWSDFSVSTISAIPGLVGLLQCPVSVKALPVPVKVNSNPETQSQLHDVCRHHHAVRVNAALKVALPEPHMAMRSLHSGSAARQQPEFLSNYQSDTDRTIHGDGRGRVVGIVKCYDQWNSGMRRESPGQSVRYLQGLSDLHRFMREHSCRYGFIMTEIELVCVRAGGDTVANNDVPLFGFLELATPIQMATHGLKGSQMEMYGISSIDESTMQMTATLALFYLHMLAKETPLPGQHGWKIEVGGPGALTRQTHLDRDDWMPKPNQGEKREAKRNRGWIWPDEPLSRRECGRSKRSSTR